MTTQNPTSTEPRPVTIWGHSYAPTLVPEPGPDVSEAARLKAAITWTYEYFLYQYGDSYAFSSAIYFNDASPNPDKFDTDKQFEVLEEAQDSERTLLIRSAQSSYSLDSLEVVPVDSQYQPWDYRVLGTSSTERRIRYSIDIPPPALKVSLRQLNVLQIDSARACVHADGMPPICFPQPINVSIERSGESNSIQIDKLNDVSGSKCGLEEHLQVLFDNLFDKKQSYKFGIKFDYFYHLPESGFEVSVPITIIPPQVYSADYAERISATVRNWYQSAVLPPGIFKIGMKVYRREPSEIILNLERLLLPVEAITNLQGS